MISFNITGGMADCQGKNRLFSGCSGRKGWDFGIQIRLNFID
jgi:hypothetical protein